LFSPHSVGHLGFTGTSIWIDLEKQVHVIVLSNRVHPRRDNDKIHAFRPVLHNAIMRVVLGGE
jgi:CubicO group peptidase (beta-lactamase class C family)